LNSLFFQKFQEFNILKQKKKPFHFHFHFLKEKLLAGEVCTVIVDNLTLLPLNKNLNPTTGVLLITNFRFVFWAENTIQNVVEFYRFFF
jgi:hypothetical protein